MSKVLPSTSPCSVSRQENSTTPSMESDTEEVSLNAPEYMTDEFRMKHFKIDKCPRLEAHDWTTCPLAHDGEKARRRDPEEFKYAAIACIDMKNNGHCPRGDSCPYAHNVFEYWMHPTRYRTQVCNDGTKCKRQICFFAHRLEELRVPPRKPGFPPEWNKGRKHKNRNSNSKKKTPNASKDTGRKGISEPATKFNTGSRRLSGQPSLLEEQRLSTVCDGSLHSLMLSNAMQETGCVGGQLDAVHYPTMSSAAGHQFCQYDLGKYLAADRQHLAVQSDTQTTRGLQYYKSTLERALYSGVDMHMEKRDQISNNNDEYIPAPQGDLFGVGRMNSDVLLEVSSAYDAQSASWRTGSTLNSPEASHIHSPQKIGPFPGMGSELGSPVTPQRLELVPAKLGQSLYTHHSFDNQNTILPPYQQPYAY